MFDIYDSGLGGLNDSDFGADADQSFTSGWDQGWDDRNFGVNTNQGPLANYNDPYKNQLLFPIGGPFADPWQGKIDYGTNRRGYNGPLRFG